MIFTIAGMTLNLDKWQPIFLSISTYVSSRGLVSLTKCLYMPEFLQPLQYEHKLHYLVPLKMLSLAIFLFASFETNRLWCSL